MPPWPKLCHYCVFSKICNDDMKYSFNDKICRNFVINLQKLKIKELEKLVEVKKQNPNEKQRVLEKDFILGIKR